ncbi:ATP-binding cassette domain-containing protein [Nocardioides sp.]|uniref:ATP-binding cassette domain-containing protein n=1 Tax=Nocardioides sp. TaxID=35761 RepID=UPI0039E58641
MSSDLVTSDLSVSYDDLAAVQPLSLTVPPGVLLAVTGPSGAGKSSLLWALAGALPISGSVSLGDTPLTGRDVAARSGVALIPQGNALVSTLTAEENVLAPLFAARVPAREARERTAVALGLVGLEESGGHRVDELSGGQQQRVALARAFALRASVLLADEATSDLDAGNRERVVAALRAEADRGAIVVMATHDTDAAAAADGELALDQGVATWPRPLVR